MFQELERLYDSLGPKCSERAVPARHTNILRRNRVKRYTAYIRQNALIANNLFFKSVKSIITQTLLQCNVFLLFEREEVGSAFHPVRADD